MARDSELDNVFRIRIREKGVFQHQSREVWHPDKDVDQLKWLSVMELWERYDYKAIRITILEGCFPFFWVRKCGFVDNALSTLDDIYRVPRFFILIHVMWKRFPWVIREVDFRTGEHWNMMYMCSQPRILQYSPQKLQNAPQRHYVLIPGDSVVE